MMAIGFHLELGYQSGYLSQLKESDQWEIMRDLAKIITQTHAQEIQELATAYGFPKSIEEEYGAINNFATEYFQNGGMLIKEGEDPQVMILASAGGEYRTAKEAVGLAVCHIIMKECAKHGFHVNLTTA